MRELANGPAIRALVNRKTLGVRFFKNGFAEAFQTIFLG
jgi:hypothetical protein